MLSRFSSRLCGRILYSFFFESINLNMKFFYVVGFIILSVLDLKYDLLFWFNHNISIDILNVSELIIAKLYNAET